MNRPSSDRRDNGKQAEPTKASRSDVEVEKTVKEDGLKVLSVEVYGAEKLKRHRTDVAGRVWIPDIWGQEELLKDWIDCSAFDRSLFPTGISSARKALVEECRRANSSGVPIGNQC